MKSLKFVYTSQKLISIFQTQLAIVLKKNKKQKCDNITERGHLLILHMK